MNMAIKTESEVRTNIVNAVNQAQPTLTTRIGSVVRDVLINPTAYEFGSIYSELSGVIDGMSIWTARGNAVFDLAKNYAIYQNVALIAYGTVTFYSTTEPSTTITIPSGTSVSTRVDSNNQVLSYTTVQEVTIPHADIASYYNSDTGNWEVSVLALAETGGIKYNVAANTVVVLRSTVSGINGVYNAAEFSGGAEAESESSVAHRVTEKLAGVNIGTLSGYKENVFTLDGVQDALVVGPRDVNMNRKSVGGVDIYIKGSLPIAVDGEEYTFSSTSIPDFVISNRPVITESGGSIVNAIRTWVYGVDWEWSKDITSSLQNSVRSLDKVHWLVTPPLSANGPLFVSYVYNSLISNAQAFVTTDTQKIVTSDVLVKWASPVYISISCYIRIAQSYSFPSVQTAVETAVTELLNGYYLGQEVQQSDILAAINAVDGVYDVTSPLSSITANPTISGYPDIYNNITIPPYLYAQAGTITVTQRTT